MEATQVPIINWMEEEDMIYICNEILLNQKKEWNLAICDNMDRPRGYHAEGNKPYRERQIQYCFTYMWNLKNKINDQT